MSISGISVRISARRLPLGGTALGVGLDRT